MAEDDNQIAERVAQQIALQKVQTDANVRLQAALSILEDLDVIAIALKNQDSHRLFIEAHKTAILRLHRFCFPQDETHQHDDSDVDDIARDVVLGRSLPKETSRQTKRANKNTTKGSAKDPWKTFMALQTVKVPDCIIKHIREHDMDLAPIISRKEAYYGIKNASSMEHGAIFTTCYNNTAGLRGNKKLDQIVWLFHMLQYYDICELLSPSGVVIDAKLLSQVRAIVDTTINKGATVNPRKAVEDIYDWCRMGAVINVFVAEFGPGCIFALAGAFTKAFLNEYKEVGLSKSADRYENMVDHLNIKCGLSNKLEETKAKELGELMRASLVAPFQDWNKGIKRPSSSAGGTPQKKRKTDKAGENDDEEDDDEEDDDEEDDDEEGEEIHGTGVIEVVEGQAQDVDGQ